MAATPAILLLALLAPALRVQDPVPALEKAPKVPDYLLAAVASPARPESDRRRDADRKPAEVLQAIGVRPGMQVGDLMASTGYYTQILAKAGGPNGKVYAQNNAFVIERFADKPLTALLAQPGMENVVRLDRELEDLGMPAGGLDLALMVRFYHDTYWQGTDRAKMNAAVLKALKPGGIYAVLDHHAEAGSGERDVQILHRVDAALVKKEVLAAGFEWAGESAVLRNSKDTRDWNIFADQAARRDQTDRFLYLFRKPFAAAKGTAPAGTVDR
ncbi:MAG TPA: SAM-dependent methyltransferase [Planctomycetota bacterium]